MTGALAPRPVACLSLVLSCLLASPSLADGLGVRVEAGTVLAYDAAQDTGHGALVHLTYDLSSVQLSVGGGALFPGSQAEAPLLTGQLLAQWHPFRGSSWLQPLHLSPYLSAGVGTVSFDDEEAAARDFEPGTSIRWIHGGEHVTGLLGLGVTYGSPTDLSLSGEVRAVNATHLGFILGAGVCF